MQFSMTDYERDMYNWKHESYQQEMNSGAECPNRDDYDEHGYKEGSVIYEGNKVLDPYLVQVYGIDYARNNPIKTL